MDFNLCTIIFFFLFSYLDKPTFMVQLATWLNCGTQTHENKSLLLRILIKLKRETFWKTVFVSSAATSPLGSPSVNVCELLLPIRFWFFVSCVCVCLYVLLWCIVTGSYTRTRWFERKRSKCTFFVCQWQRFAPARPIHAHYMNHTVPDELYACVVM